MHRDHPEEIMEAIAFGITDGVITVLGILIGVFAAGESARVIAVAALAGGLSDAVANAVGTHVSEEVSGSKSHHITWGSAFAAFLSTALVAVLQVLPVFLLPIETGIWISGLIGLLFLFCMGILFHKSFQTTVKYLILAIGAAVMAYVIGKMLRTVF